MERTFDKPGTHRRRINSCVLFVRLANALSIVIGRE